MTARVREQARLQVIAAEQRAATVEMERDVAQAEAAELRHDAEQWRAWSSAEYVLTDRGADGKPVTPDAWTYASRVQTTYANGVTEFDVTPPDATVALVTVYLLKNMAREHNAWKRAARDFYRQWREQISDTPTDAEWDEVVADVEGGTQ